MPALKRFIVQAPDVSCMTCKKNIFKLKFDLNTRRLKLPVKLFKLSCFIDKNKLDRLHPTNI